MKVRAYNNISGVRSSRLAITRWSGFGEARIEAPNYTLKVDAFRITTVAKLARRRAHESKNV